MIVARTRRAVIVPRPIVVGNGMMMPPLPVVALMVPGPVALVGVPVGADAEGDDRRPGDDYSHTPALIARFEISSADPSASTDCRHVAPRVAGHAAVDVHVDPGRHDGHDRIIDAGPGPHPHVSGRIPR